MPQAAKPIRDLLLGAALIVAGNSHALDSRDPGDPRWQAWQQHWSLQQSWLLQGLTWRALDRKSTRLNFSHDEISYAVFRLKKKNKRLPL